MKKKQPTSVRFPESLEAIKEELTQIYGLHNVVCAGLLLFNQLDPAKQKEAIRKVHALDASKVVSEAELKARIRKPSRKPSKSA